LVALSTDLEFLAGWSMKEARNGFLTLGSLGGRRMSFLDMRT
jgi:hypothetical protein